MSLQSDLSNAEMYRQAEQASGNFTNAQVAIRYHRRCLTAEKNTAGAMTGATAALASLGVFDGIAINDAAFVTNKAAHETALSTLVSDGASPTQAHVTSLKSAYETMKTELLVRKHTYADRVTFETALATLVADGASPTQAHVTSANSAYTTLKAEIA